MILPFLLPNPVCTYAFVSRVLQCIIYRLHVIQSHQQLLCDPWPLISAVPLCTLPSAVWHMDTLPTVGVSNGGSIAADVSLGGEVLLHNSLAITADKENLLPDPKQTQNYLFHLSEMA